MSSKSWSIGVVVAIALCAPAAISGEAPPAHPPSELVGTWRGTSTCTDRVAAPACKDEVVVYEFAPGPSDGTVHWKADKVVDGERQFMGEMDVTYDGALGCWKGEFQSPRVHSVWCLKVAGAHIDGTAWLLPGKETIRKVDVDRAESPSGSAK